MTKKRSMREGFWIAVIFVAILAFAILADWWKENAILGWSILGALAIVFAFLLYRYASVRGWIGRQVKDIAVKAVFEDAASEREPLPQETREGVLIRARGRCENEHCNYKGKPHIHHIDGNNSHNRFVNLIALCPNCHQKAHDGVFTESQLVNWVRRDWKRQKSRRPA